MIKFRLLQAALSIAALLHSQVDARRGASSNNRCGIKRLGEDSGLVSRVSKRIIGGQDSRKGEWPWLVSLQLITEDGVEHVCGGTLIDPEFVLTAAHCFEDRWYSKLSTDPSRWIARVGEHQMNAIDQTELDMDVRRIILHPRRNLSASVNYDIALVELKHPVSINEYADIACLPTSKDQFSTGKLCTTIGWGLTDQKVRQISETPKHVQVPIVDVNACAASYDTVKHLFDTVDIPFDMICAGVDVGGKDACQYDSGGPLMCRSETGSWVVSGVISLGFGCAEAGYPGLYTDVRKYSTWIDQTMRGEIRDQNTASLYFGGLFYFI